MQSAFRGIYHLAGPDLELVLSNSQRHAGVVQQRILSKVDVRTKHDLRLLLLHPALVDQTQLIASAMCCSMIDMTCSGK